MIGAANSDGNTVYVRICIEIIGTSFSITGNFLGEVDLFIVLQ
jgi:hypothetical protein